MVAKETKSECEVENKFTDRLEQIKADVEKYVIEHLDTPKFLESEEECEAEMAFVSYSYCFDNIIDIPSKKIKSLSGVFDSIDDTFQQSMFFHIESKGMDEVEVYNRAHMDRRLFSKIRLDVNFKPSRKTAICICFGLMLNLDETIDLLKKAGYVLSHSSKADLIIEYFIEKKEYDLNILNQVLYEYGEPTLYI